MKAKHIFSFILAASLMSACTSEDLVESTGELKGKMMDASNFSLATNGFNEEVESRASYLPQYVYVLNGKLKAEGLNPEWDNDDQIGFSHIYRTTREIITNYNFVIDPTSIDGATAEFKTDNSTIFEGDYFVYYPYNNQYADYEGIPFRLSAVQAQNATNDGIVDPVVKVNMNPTDGVNDAAEIAALTKAGEHLVKFSISPRITAKAQTQQTEFKLKQYTSTLGFIIYPLNQTNDINVTRIKMVSTNGTDLEIPTYVRFNEVNNQEEAVAVVKETEKEAILLFNNVATDGKGGLPIAKDAKLEDATLAYMSMIPATYAKDTYKFVVYYTENKITKKVEIKPNSDLNLTSNKTTFVKLEVNADGATEVVDNEIWTETEFASAVAKSNEVTNGAVEYTIMQPITLENSYELKSAVPVTFDGGETVTLAENVNLTFNSAANIVFDNVISSEASNQSNANVYQGNVEIKGVASDKLVLAVRNGAEVSVLNEGAEGDLKYVVNKGELTLANVVIAERVDNTPDANTEVAVLDLSDATIGTNLTSNSAGSVTLNNVDIEGNWTNTKGDMDATEVTIGGNWTNTVGNLVAKTVTVDGNYTSTAGAQSVAAEMEDVTVAGHFSQAGGDLNLTGTNVLAYDEDATPAPVKNNFWSFSNKVNIKNSNTTVGNVYTAQLYLAEDDTENVTFTVKGESKFDHTSGATYVLVDEKATYNAEGKVIGLESATMTIEGKLTTDANVELANNLEICGTIENKANGLWILGTYGVLKFNHSHTTAPKFTNAGKVVVEGILSTAEVTSIANVQMAKDLYDAASTGILEWKGMTDLAKVDAIYALGAGCYATDLHAVITVTSESFAADLNWSNKNIIAEVADVEYEGTFATDKKFSAKNFTVITNGSSATTSFKFAGGTTDLTNGLYVVNVTETLSLKNIAEYAGAADLTSAICKDLYVFNEETGSAVFSIANGLRMNYTDTYVPAGDNYNVTWVNDKPVKK